MDDTLPQPRLNKVQINKRMDAVFSQLLQSESGIIYYLGRLEHHFANYLITLPFDKADEILCSFEKLPERVCSKIPVTKTEES